MENILFTLSFALGSKRFIFQTQFDNNAFIISILGAYLISSVFSLKDNHQIDIVFHSKSPTILISLSTKIIFCFSLSFSVSFINNKSCPIFAEKLIKD
ncbi:MAG: hypothetical protein LBC61_06875 [Candidatus Peribacteria bacterium]|nr:hypothetical protein [Candidatus Peribacteria bacterium]